MNASEFVAKALNDKKYLTEIVGHASDDVLKSLQAEDTDVDVSGGMWQLLSIVLISAAPGMGIEASSEEISAECQRQCPNSGFKVVPLLLRVGRAIKKEATRRGL